MAFNINDFRGALTGDGARPNLFEVRMNFPSYAGAAAGNIGRFMIKTAQLPGSTVGIAPVNYFGREVKVAGNRTFADWTVTVINDENFTLRRAFENWMNGINSNVGNIRTAAAQGSGSANSYAKDANVIQFAKNGTRIKEYKFVGMFPTDVTPIDLDWGSNDTIEEFSVTLAVQYWEVVL